MSIESLLNHVPAEVVYRRQPVADSENALQLWRAALERFSKGPADSELWREAVFTAAEGRGGDATASVAEDPTLRDLVERNQEASQLLAEGAARPRLQFPPLETADELDAESDFVLRLGELARLPLIRAKYFTARGDAAAAAEELLVALRVGEMICQGEGQVLHYLIGLWIRSAALTGMQRLSERFPTDVAMRQKFLAAVDQERRTPEGLPVSICADFCCISLPQLARAPEERDLRTFVTELVRTYYDPLGGEADASDEPGAPPTAAAAEDWRQEQMMFLLAGHRCPFDKAATARLMGEMVRDSVRHLRDLLEPPRFDVIAHADHLRRFLRRRRLERQVSLWPEALLPGAGELAEEESEAAAGPRIVHQPFRSLDLSSLRQKMRRISNPVGQMLATHLLAPDYSEFMLDYCGKLERTRRLLSGNL
jgi:hypothetical protein